MRKYVMMAFMVMVVSMMAAGHAIAADVNAVFMAVPRRLISHLKSFR